MENPINVAYQQMDELARMLNDRIRQLELTGAYAERDAMILYRSKAIAARTQLVPIVKGLADAQRQGGQATTPIHQPGRGGTEVGVRPGCLGDVSGRVQPEGERDQGKDG